MKFIISLVFRWGKEPASLARLPLPLSLASDYCDAAMRTCFPAAVAALLAFAPPIGASTPIYKPCRATPPSPAREFRAAWVATVANIDWPSAKNLSTAEQQQELLRILNCAVALKLNAIIFQVRPACDAMYASPIEPWSEYLSGTMGQAPQPYYDPLAFAIEQAHRRGLELHAWFNPFRARLPAAPSAACAQHVSKSHPALVRQYGKSLWLDPGEKEVQDYSLNVVMDVVNRYDVDGVHFDDYFYPYKEKDAAGNEIDFPDGPSWRRYGAASGLSREDWRRENINRFIRRVYTSIKSIKPWVKFGVSPFGIWRDGCPRQIHGFDAYAKLYADSRKWLTSGWVDYFAPQLYWPIDAPEQSFPTLLKWWSQQNPQRRLLAPGLDVVKGGAKWKPDEIGRQVLLTRRQSGTAGEVFWNMKSLMRDNALQAMLQRQLYAEPALMPPAPWLGGTRPEKPLLFAQPLEQGGGWMFDWKSASSSKAWLWLLQTRTAGRWSTELLPGGVASRRWTAPPPELLTLCAIDRVGNMSPPAAVMLARSSAKHS